MPATLAAVHRLPRVALITLLIACAHAAPPTSTTGTTATSPRKALPDGPPLATPGEHMQYALSLRGVDLATYDIAIADVTTVAGKSALLVQSHAKVTGFAALVADIDDQFTSWVDVTNGRSLRFQTDEYASGSKTDLEHVIVDLAARAGDAIPITLQVNDVTIKTETQRASQPIVWDHNALLLALRAWEAPTGTRLALEVFRSRYMWHVDVTIGGKENHVTALGDFPALRIDGAAHRLDRKGARDASSAPRTFTMWISDDDGRVPLEILATTDYGDLRMAIIDYQPGSGNRLRL